MRVVRASRLPSSGVTRVLGASSAVPHGADGLKPFVLGVPHPGELKDARLDVRSAGICHGSPFPDCLDGRLRCVALREKDRGCHCHAAMSAARAMGVYPAAL